MPQLDTSVTVLLEFVYDCCEADKPPCNALHHGERAANKSGGRLV